MKRAGLDIGSTTVKAAVIGENDELLYSQYRRHFSDIRKTVFDIISELGEHFKGERMMIAVTGSGGISVSKWLGIPFVQEVAAGTNAIKKLIPRTDVAIELGGEDAKITYLTGGLEQRMNGSCAGGTGAGTPAAIRGDFDLRLLCRTRRTGAGLRPLPRKEL